MNARHCMKWLESMCREEKVGLHPADTVETLPESALGRVNSVTDPDVTVPSGGPSKITATVEFE